MVVPAARNDGVAWRMLCTALALLFTVFHADAAEQGMLVSPGGGPDAGRHELPDTAIDTERLPHTRLSESTPDTEPLPFYRIGPDTYFLYGNIATLDEDNRGFNGNAGFVVTGEGVLLIDTLGTPKLGRRLIATIRSVTDQPIRYLVVTHHHPDHYYGAAAFDDIKGLEVISHGGMREYLGSPQMQRSVEYRRQLLPDDMAGFRSVQPDRVAPSERFDRMSLTLGGRRFDIYNVGHHHSDGDLVVHQVGDGILWISDLAFNQRVTFMGEGDSRQILEGLDWLQATFPDVELMVPGHGSAQRPPFPMLDRTRAYVTGLRELMKEQLQAGATLQDAMDAAGMPEWKDVPLYEENQRANAGFLYREMEFEFF